jgi:hypothetical protein
MLLPGLVHFIVRMALHLGLHQCPGRFEQFSPAEIDNLRRLFWSIYSLERYLFNLYAFR